MALTLPELRGPTVAPGQGHFPRQMCAKVPPRVLWRAAAGDTLGAAPPPFPIGGWGAGCGSQWPARLRRAAASRCGWGYASRRPRELSLGGRCARTMGRGSALSRRAGLPRARRAAAALPRAPGRPPPAAPRRRRPPLPPRDPAAPGPGAAGGKAWWGGRGDDTRDRARANKGGMWEAEGPETGRRWGPAGRSSPPRSPLFAEGPATRA